MKSAGRIEIVEILPAIDDPQNLDHSSGDSRDTRPHPLQDTFKRQGAPVVARRGTFPDLTTHLFQAGGPTASRS